MRPARLRASGKQQFTIKHVDVSLRDSNFSVSERRCHVKGLSAARDHGT